MILPRLTRRHVLGGVGAGLASALAGPARAEAPVRGGTLIAIVQPEPTVLTTTVNNTFNNGVVSVNVFDGLVTYDETLSPQPSLAERWETAPDGLSITFHLRRDVRWHDGTPFTAADVQFNMREVWKKVHPRDRITFSEVTDVETPDPYTAIFRLRRPSLVIFSALNAMEAQILPRHLYEGTDILTNPHNARPIGTGPFRFKSWNRGESIELERNPDYWDTGKPYLDRIIFRAIPDAAARAAALEAGDVHYAPYDTVPFADVERLRALPNLMISTKGYDWQAQYLMVEFNLRNPFLAQLPVRQAIAHAIDKQGLIDTVWYGIGKPATGPIPSTLAKFYTPDVPRYDYDPKRAEALLDQAGFPRKAGGVRFTLTDDFMPFHETFQHNAEYIRQNLKRVGIDMTVRSADLPGYLRRVYTNYDFVTNSGQFSIFMDPEMGLDRQYWSKAVAPGVAWTNVSGYANPAMDRLIEASQHTPDPAERSTLFHQIQQLAMTDLPILPLMEISHFTVASRRLRGLSSAPDGALASLKSVWLAPEQAG